MSKIIEAYKIKKVYPTMTREFNEGDYVYKVEGNGIFTFTNYKHVGHQSSASLSIEEVENHPEFFEKVNLQIILKEIK